ncbi:DUF2489 domain-containing protein [Marinomonas hwangdonensis]|uniref:DUF2489 domain-containing protein n=1 Tax=Marinomonas hwangdonensis TaxID=1053647 RepID=A0A3M8Q2V0_9GAMM|nr:DUF2489 domain-containing protein [Marinomonas hwangdonensis]RNF50448.1 DUF2489 domain-containing protein [Marinomonas hwangdonensis]
MSFDAFLIALLCSLVVIVISLWFIRQQLKLSQVREEKIRAGEARYEEERQKRVDSIRVLLMAAGSNELNWVEASIRIKHLLDQLGVNLADHEDISAFYIMTEKTAHIPTHEQWKDLPKLAKDKFLKEMQAYEQEHGEHLLRAKSSLMSYSL